MKRAIVILGSIAVLTVGCKNKLTNRGDDTVYGVPPHSVAGANLFHGTINGEAADVLIYQGGNHVYGNITVGKAQGRLSGYIDPNVMELSAEPLSPVSGPQFTFNIITLQRSGTVWTVIKGGSGSITHE